MLTSIQILNLQGIIQEDALQYLQFATEFAKFTSASNGQLGKPFESFLFLIRDWGNPEEFAYGIDGGEKYLESVLVVEPTQPAELQAVRNHVKSSFEKLSCCLMPYPGNAVARDSAYDGRWRPMEADFLNQLTAIISNLLTPENLVTKKINNVEMNAREVNEYFQQFINLFIDGSSVQPKSIYESTIDKFLSAAVVRSFDGYKSQINSGLSAISDENGIATLDGSSKAAGFAVYEAERKMGTDEHVSKYRNALTQKMEMDAIEWKALALANILRIREERQKAEEAAREAERLRLQTIEQERLAQEKIAQLEQEAREREAEAARQAEALRQQQLAIQAEQERQRLAEEQRQREIAEQQKIQAELAAEAERIRNSQHKKHHKCSVM